MLNYTEIAAKTCPRIKSERGRLNRGKGNNQCGKARTYGYVQIKMR